MKRLLLVTTLVVSVFMMACSENAHLNRTDPLTQDGGSPQKTGANTKDKIVRLELTDSDSKEVIYKGDFETTDDSKIKYDQAVEGTSGGKQSWNDIKDQFRMDSDKIDQIQFDKKKWAEINKKKYQLFDPASGNPVAPPARSKPQALTLKIVQVQAGEPAGEIIKNYPIKYRYAIDDEAHGAGRLNADNSVSYPTGLHGGRVVRGLEYASSVDLLYRNVNCGNQFDFVDVVLAPDRKNFSGRVLQLRSSLDHSWKNVSGTNSGSVLQVIGQVLSSASARFTPVNDFGGLCTFKVMGIILMPDYTPQIIDGIRLRVVSQDKKDSGDVIFGVSIFEAY